MFKLADETLDKIYTEYTISFDYFERVDSSDNSYPKLSKEQLKELIESVFWTSLLKEEGRFHKSVLSFCPIPEESVDEDTRPYIFTEPLSLDLKKLTQLFTALDSTKERIYVCLDNNQKLKIWGFGNPNLIIGQEHLIGEQLTIKSFDAGQLIISFTSPTSQNSLFVDSTKAEIIDSEKNPFLRFFRQQNITDIEKELLCYETLCNLMREHMHGGTLLIVDEAANWRNSCKDLYFASESEYTLKHLLQILNIDSDEVWKQQGNSSTNYLKKTSDLKELLINGLFSIARLTELDGATVLSHNLSVKGFGVKINASSRIKNVLITESLKNSKEKSVNVSDLGGTRHQSAAHFISKNKNSLAIVASQDGKVSVMFWNTEKSCVFITKHIEYLFSDSKI